MSAQAPCWLCAFARNGAAGGGVGKQDWRQAREAQAARAQLDSRGLIEGAARADAKTSPSAGSTSAAAATAAKLTAADWPILALESRRPQFNSHSCAALGTSFVWWQTNRAGGTRKCPALVIRCRASRFAPNILHTEALLEYRANRIKQQLRYSPYF